MSVAGYLDQGGDRELSRKTIEEALQKKVEVRVAVKPEEKVYESTADYDPVLRSHCRLR
jgi:hypothetical protein